LKIIKGKDILEELFIKEWNDIIFDVWECEGSAMDRLDRVFPREL
jgi:hypothetical protein